MTAETVENAGASAPAGSGARRIVALVVGIVALLATAPACFVAISAVFVFDAPGSEDSGLAWAIALGLLAAPLVTLATAIFGFLLAQRFTRARGIALVALPGLYLLYLIVVMSRW